MYEIMILNTETEEPTTLLAKTSDELYEVMKVISKTPSFELITVENKAELIFAEEFIKYIKHHDVDDIFGLN